MSQSVHGQSPKAVKRTGNLLLKSVEIGQEVRRSPASLDIDAIKSPFRQEILFYVADRDTPASRETLAKHLAAWEAEMNVGSVSAEERERIHVVLHHKHLPQLVDAGLIEYDQQDLVVDLTEYAEKLLQD